MEMRTGHVSGVAAEADDLSIPDLLSSSNMDGREVSVDGEKVTGVLQPDHLPVPRLASGETDPTPGHGPDLRSVRYVDVHTAVEIQGKAPGT